MTTIEHSNSSNVHDIVLLAEFCLSLQRLTFLPIDCLCGAVESTPHHSIEGAQKYSLWDSTVTMEQIQNDSNLTLGEK